MEYDWWDGGDELWLLNISRKHIFIPYDIWLDFFVYLGDARFIIWLWLSLIQTARDSFAFCVCGLRAVSKENETNPS